MSSPHQVSCLCAVSPATVIQVEYSYINLLSMNSKTAQLQRLCRAFDASWSNPRPSFTARRVQPLPTSALCQSYTGSQNRAFA